MAHEHIKALIDKVAALDFNMYEKDFLLTWDKSRSELDAVLHIAETLELMYKNNISSRAFLGGLAVSNFRDKSTRTRFSFASAASLLGLSLQDIDETKIQVAHGETVRETANMISFLSEVYGIRDDIFVGEGHEYMLETAASIEDGYRHGCLPQRTSVVSLQCDRDHPTQSLSDLMHIKSLYGSLDALKGKKIAMTWAYSPTYGKPLSVAQGIINLMTRYGMQVTLAYPEGYNLMPGMEERASDFAKASGGSFKVCHSMDEAFKDADVVYPKSWGPYDMMLERTRLLRAGESSKLGELEKAQLASNPKHKHWECNEELMKLTHDGKAHYMHPLPADLTGISCTAGEVAQSVFERYRLETYQEASHKLYVIAAMILSSRFAKPAELLNKMLERAEPRRLGA